MALNERMRCRAVPGCLEPIGIEGAVRSGNHRQDGAGHALSADVEHRPDLFNLRQRGQLLGQGSKIGEGRFVKQVACRPLHADDAVAVGGAEPVANSIDEGKFLVDRRGSGPARRANAPQQGAEVVINPDPGQAVAGQARDQEDSEEAPASPASAGSRWYSSGSTIQPRQVVAPQRHRMAVSAGQQ